jgi:sulfur-oxidizing protein SoxZ
MAERTRLRVPKEARRGEIVEIKTLINHVMETGLRKDAEGKVVPRKIIKSFSCTFNDKPVIACDLEPAMAANPYIQFTTKVDESGVFKFVWIDDDGTITTAQESIKVV